TDDDDTIRAATDHEPITIDDEPPNGPIGIANQLELEDFRDLYLSPTVLSRATLGTKLCPADINDEDYDFAIELHSPSSLSTPDFEDCFRLVRFTSADHYKKCSLGWKPLAKRSEMLQPYMRYLVVKAKECDEVTGKEALRLAGFLSFLLLVDDDLTPVIYCYEIHIVPVDRRWGIGTHLMALMEEVGRSVGAHKAMLTLLLTNKDGSKFYDRLG
ncbi:hypothetical protein GP486_008552, partial [Trichoglossum hirsutum]